MHESAALKAHPRSRGENRMPRTTRVIATGSSPLTRGKLVGDRLASTVYRLIPAHAGKTLEAVGLHGFGPAHPRSRGENDHTGRPRPSGTGSSPLTRGKLWERCLDFLDARLIPAHAGKTSRTPRQVTSYAAHPRSRGENSFLASGQPSSPGSSPLTRGKRVSKRALTSVLRLIPAHAGKTSAAAVGVGRPSAHPRSRGENGLNEWECDDDTGSSPLTRGKPGRGPRSRSTAGLIPAHAGKTPRLR